MKYQLSGRPSAPQFRMMRTEAEFKTFMRETDSGARHFADEYMAYGRSKWIERAKVEGWSHVLRSLVCQLARKDRLEYGDFPTNSRMDQLVISRDDHERFKFLGRSSR